MEQALVTSTEPPTERQLIDRLSETIRTTLPTGWNSRLTAAADPRIDAVLEIAGPDGRSAKLLVEAKSIIDARDVPAIREQLATYGGPAASTATVIARYLSPRARMALSEAGLSYMDATGNLSLVLSEPAVFLQRTGANRDPWRTPDRPTSSLRGKPAARVVRALVDMRPPWKIRELAAAAGTSLGSTSRAVDFVTREALVERDESGLIVKVDWRALLMRWSEDYDLAKRRRLVRLIAPKGLTSVQVSLRSWQATYAITGSLAAERWAPYAESRLGIVYTPDADELRERLGLRDSPGAGNNLLLIEPDDDVVFDRSLDIDGLRYVAPSQAVVDLLAGPGRNPEEGIALLDWMQSNEERWRGA